MVSVKGEASEPEAEPTMVTARSNLHADRRALRLYDSPYNREDGGASRP